MSSLILQENEYDHFVLSIQEFKKFDVIEYFHQNDLDDWFCSEYEQLCNMLLSPLLI